MTSTSSNHSCRKFRISEDPKQGLEAEGFWGLGFRGWGLKCNLSHTHLISRLWVCDLGSGIVPARSLCKDPSASQLSLTLS